jgi:hypothetical protein
MGPVIIVGSKRDMSGGREEFGDTLDLAVDAEYLLENDDCGSRLVAVGTGQVTRHA